MNEATDTELLRDYAERGNEAAFCELVARHTDFVYSSALRQVNSPDLAADVAQSVFADLARKAGSLAQSAQAGVSLAGWLYRGTRFAALNQLRDERRRRARERQAMEHFDPAPGSASEWERMRPVLDQAMSELGEADREALLLRFFKNYDLRAVGQALGTSDDAAQKRVGRALEKLRALLSERGVTTSAAALSVALSANAVTPAPAGLASLLFTTALTGTAISASTAISATKTIAMTTLQKVILGAALSAAIGTGIYAVHQEAQKRQRDRAFQQQQASLNEQLRELQRERDQATGQARGLLAENRQLRSNQNEAELLRLRGQVGALSRETDKLRQLILGMRDDSRTNHLQYPTNLIAKGSWGFAGYNTPAAALESTLWAKSTGNENIWLDSLSDTNAAETLKKNYIKGDSEEERSRFLVDQTTNWTGFRILKEVPVSEDMVLLQVQVSALVNGKKQTADSIQEMRKTDGIWKSAQEYMGD
ncbi:MAG: sigma-70 family RNA polymerase sigma factor [Limisphaerales bacterium]